MFGGFVEKQLQTLSFAQPVLLPDEANGCCYCLVEASGERTFMSIHGAEYSFNPAWMAPYAANHYAYGYVCGLEVEEKTGGLLVDYLKNAPIDRIFYAPGPRGAGIAIERQNALYALHPILHLNGAEASALSGLDGLDESLLFLHEKTQAPVIATLGSLGARVLTVDGALLTVPGYPAEHVLDTIGAGDAHAGAVLLGLSRGLSLPDAVALGNRVSAAVVQTAGATLSDGDFAKLSIHKQGTEA